MPWLPVRRGRWTRARLDPRRARTARVLYDETGGYAAWSAYCRASLSRSVDARPEDGLARRGFEVVSVFSAADAAAIKTTILSRASTSGPSKKDIDYADVMQFDDSSFLLP